MDRDVPARERLDLLRQDVAGDDGVTQLGEACSRAEPDPADADDADRFLLSHAREQATDGYGWRVERAMAIICRSLSVCSSVFDTQ